VRRPDRAAHQPRAHRRRHDARARRAQPARRGQGWLPERFDVSLMASHHLCALCLLRGPAPCAWSPHRPRSPLQKQWSPDYQSVTCSAYLAPLSALVKRLSQGRVRALGARAQPILQPTALN
jgi:hypothetical protein